MAARLVFRIHAVQRMSERGITERDVREILSVGETIEEYPDDTPYASRLVLGWCRGRPLHVVVAEYAKAHQIPRSGSRASGKGGGHGMRDL